MSYKKYKNRPTLKDRCIYHRVIALCNGKELKDIGIFI